MSFVRQLAPATSAALDAVEPALLRVVTVVTLAEDDVLELAAEAQRNGLPACPRAVEGVHAVAASLRRQLAEVEALLERTAA